MKIKAFAIFVLIFFATASLAVSAPKTVKFVGQWPFHPTKMIAVDADRGFVFCGNGDTLVILDADLNFISSIRVTESGEITSLFYDPDRPAVFITCKNDGLRIINVDDPAKPFKSGEYHPDGTGQLNGVFVQGDKAYLAGHLAINNSSGGQDIFDMQILDLTASQPSLILSVHLLGAFGITYGIDVVVSEDGKYAYVSDLYAGVHEVDLSSLADTNKQRDHRLMVLPGARDILLSGNYLYVSTENAGLTIVDISDPENPTTAGYDSAHPDVQTGVYNPDNPVRAVRVDGNTAYIAETAGGLEAIDISDKSAPTPYVSSVTYTGTGARSLALYPKGNAVFITDYALGLQKIDTSTPGKLIRTASFDLPADAVAIDMLNGYAYVIDNTMGDDPSAEGLRILSVSVTNGVMQLGLTGFCATPGTASDVVATDNAAYIADGKNGLQIIDTTDKTHPKADWIATATGGFAAGVAVSGNYAYVADRTAGLVIIDVSDKNNPIKKATLPLTGTPNRLIVNGNHAWIAAQYAGLISVDVSDPEKPVIDARLDTAGSAEAIAIDTFRNLAFVADGAGGLVTVDISDPAKPVLKQIIKDNSDPAAPVMADSLDIGGSAENIIFAGAFAYVSAGKNGIIAVDTTDPAMPVVEPYDSTDTPGWSYDTAGNCLDAAFYSSGDERYILAADSGDGVVVINPTYDTSQITSSSSGSNAGCFISTLR